MGNIVLLDDLTINKIAAGEVIERPASVVKEVVENSIDAGADNISVEIRNGGISYIRITDNGKGIAADDLEIAFERHATSKIRKAEDLETVKSMGFRGEALASIAAIARVELVTKTEEDTVGHKIVVEGGNIISKEEVGCPKGTSITIENLFYNTPVRYKFLKKDFTESGYIEDTITRIALVNANIAIKLINTGKTVIQTSGNGDIKDIVYGIYGKDIAENIMNVEYYFEDMVVKGVIGNPNIARSNRSNQLFFVNKRYVKDKTLTSAAEQAFKGMLPIGKYGFLILNIEMDPHKLDVNVHPAKLEVRFQEENKIFKLVYHAIKESLLTVDKANQGEGIFGGNISDSANLNNSNYLSGINSSINNNTTNGISNSINNDLNKINLNQQKENETKTESKIDELIKSKVSLRPDFETRLEAKLNEKSESKTNSKSNSKSESKGIGGFFKNILNSSKNEFSSNDDNLVEQLYKDKIQHEHENIVNNIKGENYNTEKNVNDIQENKISNYNENEENSRLNNSETNITDNNKQVSNLEKLVKELDANLEKMNIKPSVSTNSILENNTNLTTENDNNKIAENTNIQNDEKNIECKTQENIVNDDNKEIQNDIQNSETNNIKKQDELNDNQSNDNKLENNQLDNNQPKLDDIQSKNEEPVHNTKTTVFAGKIQEGKTKESDSSFEEMYAKMFGTVIPNRNKVEEDNENGYSIKQDDLRTVENMSLFTNSSFYNRIVYKYIGIVFGSYIVIEYENEMYIINQRAVNERILFEKVKKNYYSETDKDSQLMLLPDIINLTDKQMGIAKDNMEMFRKAGFDLEEFGDKTIKLSGVPNLCIDMDTKQLFLDILEEINTVARTARKEVEDKFIETIACKAADKCKIVLTQKEVDNLMQQLLSLPQPFVSPNGNPTAVRMSKIDIEKKFSRR